MENDFDIEIQDSYNSENEMTVLPNNFLSFGDIEADDIRVYIKQNVYKALEKYALEDTTKERGTILLGNYCSEHGKKHIVISDYIEAKYTDASASTLTFTHETWEYVHSEHDSKYSDKKIIGWQHTHPNYGIFLSNYDLFIQENFFNLDFQVAYVIDPIQDLRGFFQWKNGKIEKLKGYYIYDDSNKPVKIEQTRNAQKEITAQSKKTEHIQTVLTALLCVLSIILIISVFSLRNMYVKQANIQDNMQVTIDAQQEYLYSQEEKISEIKETAEENKNQYIHYIMYTVKADDTLMEICKENDIDYYANVKIILSLNGIDNPDNIYIGQNIILPIMSQNK